MDRIQRIRSALGPLPLLAEWWAELATIGDAWSRRLELTRELADASRAVGITNEQWSAILGTPSKSVAQQHN